MKTIKDRKSVRVYTFVFVLMLILLLSLMIGTTLGAKPDKPGKPDKPEEPPPDLVPADFEIRIGEGSEPQNIKLLSPSFLDVQDEVGGYWLPRTKGKASREGWGVSLRQDEEEDCGTYIIEPVPGETPDETPKTLTEALDHPHLEPEPTGTYSFYIGHSAETDPRRGEHDWWRIHIQWQVGWLDLPYDPPIPHLHTLWGITNEDTVWEGVYDEKADTWTVTFDNTWFSLMENHESGESIELWTGQLSFTVEIKRILS